jgi:carbamoyl-phosphate synthase small subunit
VNFARLIFEDGVEFRGRFFSDVSDSFGEVVFNTAMGGYQEVLTDPSYAGQMVVMTYPLIGNYGINAQDVESRGLFLKALLVKEYIDFPSNFRSTQSLKKYLNDHGIIGVEGLDTRAITRYVRDNGAKRALITGSSEPLDQLVARIQASPSMVGQNLAAQVTCETPYVWAMESNPLFKVAVIDCGVKYNILRHLAKRGCECHVFPNHVSAETILSGGFDGLFLSNGPGDPEVVTDTIAMIKEVLGKLPIFGICLGHQLLALALGAKTEKLKFGHHGVNHPVKNLLKGDVEITSQNHGFCVKQDSLSPEVEVTHLNLNDGTVEGIKHRILPAFSVQYHPESAPGPSDSNYLFDDFIQMMAQFKNSPAQRFDTYVSR